MLDFSGVELAGPLPESWMQPGAFPELALLNLSSTQISGTLPAGWGQAGALSRLCTLGLGDVNLSGERINSAPRPEHT